MRVSSLLEFDQGTILWAVVVKWKPGDRVLDFYRSGVLKTTVEFFNEVPRLINRSGTCIYLAPSDLFKRIQVFTTKEEAAMYWKVLIKEKISTLEKMKVTNRKLLEEKIIND